MKKGARTRKGQAEFIGWVLLIGFAVVIAAFVGNWMLQRARETTESVIEMTTKDMRCSDVSVSVNCKEGNAEIVNTGYFTVKKLACYKNTDYNLLKFEIKPRESKPLNEIDSCDSIVPIVEVDKKEIGCSEKQVEVKCE